MSEEDILSVSLGLRNNAHQVKLVLPNGATKPVLGTNDPEEEQRRLDIVKQWGTTHEAPRPQALVGIEQPLTQRTQTILYYQLPAAERQALHRGFSLQAKSRKYRNEVNPVTLLPPK
jgi:hypothetical protein